MSEDYRNDYPWTRELTVESPAADVYGEVRERLRGAGFTLLTERAPEAEPGAAAFEGAFTAKRDIVLDARRRRTGKIMLGFGIGLTVVLLVMLAEGIGAERSIVSPLLLVAVILGGLGMERLRNPEQRVRRLLEVRVTSAPDGGALIAAKGGLGPAFGGDWVSVWSEEQDLSAEAAFLDGLGATAGSRARTEGAA